MSGLRGVVGNGLDPLAVLEFAAAYASTCARGPILVGHDARAAVAPFEAAVQSAILATGRDAWMAGPVATPTLGVLVGARQAAGAIQISASHNPPEYTGLKLFATDGAVLSPEAGAAVLARIEQRAFDWAPWNRVGRVRTLESPDTEHLRRVLSLVDVDAIGARRFRVALDSAHGSGGRLAARLLEELGCETVALGAVADGRYEHPPEPTEANLTQFAAVVRALGFDVGFAQDPDADRLAVIDNRGCYIGEELTIAMASDLRLRQQPGVLAVNLSTTRLVDDIAARHGSRVVRAPVGEYHVVNAMRANNAVLGGEGNGGVIDPRVGFVRDSLVGMALVLELLAREGCSLSDYVQSQPRYAMVKTKLPMGETLLSTCFEHLCRRFEDARVNRDDGLRLDWPDRWVHVRASNTEPLVRVIAEAPDRADALDLADRVGRCLSEPN